MRILGGLLILMTIIALGSYASLNIERIQHVEPYPTTISVTGEGEVFGIPDIGQFTFSVNAEADDAAAAQEQSGTRMTEIVTYLAEQGVAETDIKTEAYNLYPRWRFEERVCAAGSYCPPGERVQDGFEVSQTVSVKVRETDRAGELIAGVGERGATNISGLNFTVDDQAALKKEAREAAIKDAQEQAVALASQLGVSIVKLAGFHEQSEQYDPYMMDRAYAVEGMGGDGFAGAPMPTGEESTLVRVNLTYEVR